MADLRVDVPDEVVAALEERAPHLGLTREQLVQQVLRRDVASAVGPVTLSDLQRFSTSAADLADPEVMGAAWT